MVGSPRRPGTVNRKLRNRGDGETERENPHGVRVERHDDATAELSPCERSVKLPAQSPYLAEMLAEPVALGVDRGAVKEGSCTS